MLVRFELLKLHRSRRPLLAVLACLLFLSLMLIGFYTYAQTETGGRAEFRYTYQNPSYFNGLTFALYAFYFGFLLILPIFTALEGSAQLAGETHDGTLYLLLTRPVSRESLFLSKALVSLLYSGLLVGFLMLSSLLLGLIFVGWGDLNLYPGVLQMTARHQFLPQQTALQRFLLAWPAACLGLASTLSLALLVSSRMRNPVNAAGVSISLYLVLYAISEIHLFQNLRPLLFTSYLGYWRGFFQEIIPWRSVLEQGFRLLAFSFLFLAFAFHRFRLREEM